MTANQFCLAAHKSPPAELRIPAEKITHSELKKLNCSPSDAGKALWEQMIIIVPGICSTTGNICTIVGLMNTLDHDNTAVYLCNHSKLHVENYDVGLGSAGRKAVAKEVEFQ